jgi:histidinol-phosphatase
MTRYQAELDVGLEAVRAAGSVQLRGRDALPPVELKSDRSPVTAIDRECERTIIDIIAKRFPGDGFLGEEGGEQPGPSGRRWIIDPLDGTRPFLKGIPTHSVLLALEEDGDLVVGIMNLPAMDLALWATKGGGAFQNGRPVQVSKTAVLDRSFGSGFGFLEPSARSAGEHLLRLMRSADYCYGFMDAYSYACVAAGRMDFTISLADKPWDNAAPACIIREAGGVVTDLAGTPSIYNGATIATNGYLHDAVLKYFQ